MENLYSTAHLFVAAIRVLEHQQDIQPSVDDVCRLLALSSERGIYIANRLCAVDIIGYIEGAFESRIFVKNHLKIEDIPKENAGNSLEDEIVKFEDSKKHRIKKIESFQSEQAQKKKDLFADMEKKLKEELKKHPENL